MDVALWAWNKIKGERMHTILFDSYRKYQKDNKQSLMKTIFKLPIGVKLLLIGFVLCLIYSILALFIDFFKSTYFICLILQVILCLCLYFYTENFQIKTSDIRLSTYQEYCGKIKAWLTKTGVIVTQENVTELVSRIEKEIDKLEKKKTANRERIEKWIQILIIPILLAVFSAIIREQNNLTILFAYTTTFLIALGSLSLAFLNCYNIFDFFKKRKIEQLKSLSSDLQGVLDCQFDNKIFSVNEQSIDSEGTAND